MIISLNELRVVQVAAGDPIGFEPGWYAVHEASAKCWGPFATLGAWSDWVWAHKVEGAAK